MSDNTINIEINGTPLQAGQGEMLIAVADRAGIRIPRFCYHNKLSIAANCRMCLVEVEKAPKPLPACATPVMDGMKVFTRSPRALAAQKSTMEFLLINHPLDCPICDQGGECELQDVAVGYGGDVSKYSEAKRVVQDKNIGPLIATEMTRCIHCTRCVRFGQEIAGVMELGATGRGEFTRIGTYIERSVNSEMSGNIIDVCPVGALTAKPSRFSARAWELVSNAAIAPHDCVGSNIFVHTFRGKVNRVVPRDNEKLNECWLSDRDRFSYEGVNSEQRLTTPMVKRNGEWKEVDWDEALELATNGIQKVCSENGAEQLGALVSSSATTEEMYLLNNIMNGLGSTNLDHRLRQCDFSDQSIAPVFPSLGVSIDELEKLDAALLIGSNVRKEQPIVAHRLRKAAMSGAKIMTVNSRDFDVHFHQAESIVAAPSDMVNELAAIAKSITGSDAPDNLKNVLQNASPNTSHETIAEHLQGSDKASILLGSQAQMCPGFSTLRALAELIAAKTNANLGYLTEGANSSGAWLAGAVPHRNAVGQAAEKTGLDALAMLDQSLKAYILHSLEPEYDCWNPAQALKAVGGAEFVVMLTPFVTDTMLEYADVLLPVAPFTETSGTYVNIEGSWQSFTGVSKPVGDSRPAWKVLRVLGNLLDIGGFEYVSSEEVLDELKGKLGEMKTEDTDRGQIKFNVPVKSGGVCRISGVSIYSVDGITRRAGSLQKTSDAMDMAVRLNTGLSQRLKLQGAQRVRVRQ
ncbi:MAG: NADH-quinone oxidoreductase subunit G, partial [Gammaproteobacteria bacterium]|nr:NADH-quinone oxidoreductase subunit G [Gammaproteobacteria bacterium]